uniref:Uncharacterized protein n=1 Tax=Kalmanozyma brasiliensis (strain GHG001) TaxID=1365824 RepID=V5E3D0_KALBG
MWAFLIGLLLTAIFFRSVLPRLPRILFRGKLRINRAGLRGIRGIEYRSKGFHNDSAAFSRNENQLEVKIQRIYATIHLPYFLRKAEEKPKVVPRKSGAIITLHVQGVGGIALRAFRAALFILTSSLPVLTSFVSIQVDRIEVYIQEAEAVARIGRAGLTFSMSPDSSSAFSGTRETSQSSDDAIASSSAQEPTWSRFFEAMRTMPTRADI